MDSFPVLTDNDLLLREFRSTDEQELLLLAERADADEFTDAPFPLDIADVRRWLLTRSVGWQEGSGVTFALVQNNHLVGGLELTFDDRGHAQVSCWLAPFARGRGLAARAVDRAAQYALTRSPRVAFICSLQNRSGQALAANAGFDYEGMLRNWDGPGYWMLFSRINAASGSATLAGPTEQPNLPAATRFSLDD